MLLLFRDSTISVERLELEFLIANKIKFNRKPHAHPPSICEANCKEAPQRSEGQSGELPDRVDGVLSAFAFALVTTLRSNVAIATDEPLP